MEETLKKAFSTAESLLGSNYKAGVLEGLIEDTLDLFMYRFVKDGLITNRPQVMTGLDISDYNTILQTAEKSIDTLVIITEIIKGKSKKIESELDIYFHLKKI